MVNSLIKVFARLKTEKSKKTMNYCITKDKNDFDNLNFTEVAANVEFRITKRDFRFQKVFDQHSHQSEIFDIVAVPVINSVLEGFNGTVFAYGQTGSGKTYTITGSPKNYNDRGIIPRAIEYIFRRNEKLSIKPTLHISYMEIYNEIGYDLLGAKYRSFCLEELPRVIVLEDGNGEPHVRNLSVLPVSTEQEAMRLLFFGDTNRTIAETPMNEYSSRSHCIFTIYITLRDKNTNKVRFSKLHFVDLAGSERVYKTLSTGTALNEAKFINLSLHHLQQVIMALSQPNRIHVPYRNSLITNLLKDSLGGNCLTSMLATMALTKENFMETISTCKFTQSVSLVKTAAVINEIADSRQEIIYLKNRVHELEMKLAELTGFTESGNNLNEYQRKYCQAEVESFLNTQEPLKVDPDLSQIQFCFNLLKEKVLTEKKMHNEQVDKNDKLLIQLAELKKKFIQKDNEITKLKKLKIPVRPPTSCGDKVHHTITNYRSLSATSSSNMVVKNQNEDQNFLNGIKCKSHKIRPMSSSCCQTSSNNANFTTLSTPKLIPFEEPNHSFSSENQVYNTFLLESGIAQDLSYYQSTLTNKYESAKLFSEVIEQCQKNITFIRGKLEMTSNGQEKLKLIGELESQQKMYKKSLEEIRHIRNETFHLESSLKKVELQAEKRFKTWLDVNSKSNKSQNSNLNNKQQQRQNGLCENNNPPGRDCSRLNSGQNHKLSNDVYLYEESTEASADEASCCCAQQELDSKTIENERLENCYYNEQESVRSIGNETFTICKGDNCSCNGNNLERETTFVLEGNCSYTCGCVAEEVPKATLNVLMPSVNQIEHYAELPTKDTSDFSTAHTEKKITNKITVAQTFSKTSQKNNENKVGNGKNKLRRNEKKQTERYSNFFKESDTTDFKDFMSTVTLTGDDEIDKEIFEFYRHKFVENFL